MEHKYFKLHFVQLRSNIGQQFEKVAETIMKFFKEEKDYLYRNGAEQKSREFVSNLIQQTEFDDAKITELAVVSVAFVRKVRADLDNEQKK